MDKPKNANQAEVLAILEGGDKPLSAYEILDILRKRKPKAAAPTVYRALTALIEAGHVHRLESLNAFMACNHSHHDETSVMSICGDCGTVEESVEPELAQTLAKVAGKTGFETTRQVIEVHGICATCSEESDHP